MKGRRIRPQHPPTRDLPESKRTRPRRPPEPGPDERDPGRSRDRGMPADKTSLSANPRSVKPDEAKPFRPVRQTAMPSSFFELSIPPVRCISSTHFNTCKDQRLPPGGVPVKHRNVRFKIPAAASARARQGCSFFQFLFIQSQAWKTRPDAHNVEDPERYRGLPLFSCHHFPKRDAVPDRGL